MNIDGYFYVFLLATQRNTGNRMWKTLLSDLTLIELNCVIIIAPQVFLLKLIRSGLLAVMLQNIQVKSHFHS